MTVKYTIKIFLIAVFITPSMAQASWYLGLQLHSYSYSDESAEFSVPPEPDPLTAIPGTPRQEGETFKFKSKFDSDTDLAFLIGIDNESFPLRIEIDYAKYKSSIDNFGNEGTGQLFTGDMEMQTFVFSTWYDFRNIGFLPEGLHPYVGGGAGLARVEMRKSEGGTENDVDFIARIGAGISYRIFDALAVDFGYRYFETVEMEFETDEGVASTAFSGNLWLLSLRYYWGGEWSR